MNNKRIFLGIKQVLKTTFDSYSLEEKVGYVWFVRNEEDNHLEIYLGSIKYADTNENVASQEYVDNIIEKLRITIGLDENLNLPQDFNYETIINAINDLFDNKTELLMQMSGLTNDIETLKNEIINNEHVISESILTIKDLIGLTNNFTLPYDFAHYNTIIEGINDRYRKSETYSKNEIHRLINGFFRFKGKVEYISDLELILNPINGDVYMVEKKSIETPVVINSEFVYTTDEFGLLGEWIELGPLFDITIFDEKFNSIKDAIGLTDDLKLPEDFKQDSIIDAINETNENYNEIKNDVNSLQEQIDIVVSGLPKTYTVNFYLDDETYNNPRFIAKTTIHEGDCLIDYPSIRIDDYSDYAYWDTELYDLYHISNDINVSYVTTIINRVKNPQLLDIMYNEHLCNDYNYMKISEAQTVNDEQWFKLSNTIKYIEIYGQSNLIEVTGEIYNNDGKLMNNYNLWNWEVYDGDEILSIIDNGFYTFDLNGNKIEFNSDTINTFYNEFYMLENFDEFQYFTNITSISSLEDGKGFVSFIDSNIKSIKLPNSVTSIGRDAFSNCSSLTSVTIPNSVTSIENGVFNACSSLTSVTIPNSVTSIGGTAFGFCSSLTSVTIPNSVTSVENRAFSGCTSLTSITLNWTDSESILPFNTNWYLPTVPSYYTYPEGLESLYYEKGWPSQFTLECVISNGTVEITPSLATYPYGTDVTLTVTPNDGQEFLGWNDMNMENPRTITITGNTTLEGYCTSYVYHTITIGEVQNGNLSVDYTTAKVGDVITITPTAEYGYENPNIEVTTENGEVIEVIVSKLGDYSFTMPDDNVTITGYFRPKTIDVTLTANNCTITSEIGTLQDSTGTYGADYQSEITLVVTPNNGYTFKQWSDGNTDNPRTIVVTQNIVLTAVCEETIVVFEAVDLGLPSGTLWANMNVGATAPYEYGNYYAWGETKTKGIYTWNNYKYGTEGNLTKYNATDGLTTLESTDDAASVNLGGTWRMPTDDELTELIENCTWTWTDNYNGTGVAGQIVTSNTNSNSIFLPASGYRISNDVSFLGSNGYYWSSSLNTTKNARNVYLSSDNVSMDYFIGYRYTGVSVRPVKTQQPTTQIYYNATEDLSTSVGSTLGSVNLVADSCTYDSTTGDGVLTYDGDVTEITNNYFDRKTQLVTISLPDSVTNIGHSAFGNCSSLTSITIGNSVTRIENYAFGNCTSITSVIIPNSVTYIGSQCFSNCPLTSINLPYSLKEFGDSVSVAYPTFYNSQFEEITIPKNVEIIHDQSAPIRNNDKLKKIIWNVSSSVSVFNSSDRRTLSYYDSTNVTELEFGENVVFIPLLIRVSKSITKITCKSLVAPTTESSAIRTMAATNGELHVKTGCDYSSLLSELGSGWTIVYDVE